MIKDFFRLLDKSFPAVVLFLLLMLAVHAPINLWGRDPFAIADYLLVLTGIGFFSFFFGRAYEVRRKK